MLPWPRLGPCFPKYIQVTAFFFFFFPLCILINGGALGESEVGCVMEAPRGRGSCLNRTSNWNYFEFVPLFFRTRIWFAFSVIFLFFFFFLHRMKTHTISWTLQCPALLFTFPTFLFSNPVITQLIFALSHFLCGALPLFLLSYNFPVLLSFILCLLTR